MTTSSKAQKQLEGIGARLLKALERRAKAAGERVDKKAFAGEIRERFEGRGGQKGVSYMSILAYLDGESTPSLEWLVEASDTLGVRVDWLAFGTGEMTQDEEDAREIEARAVKAAAEGMAERFYGTTTDTVLRIIKDEVPAPSYAERYDLQIIRLWQLFTERIDNNAHWYKGEQPMSLSSLRTVCRMLVASANLACIDLTRLEVHQFEQYIRLSAEACTVLLGTSFDVADAVPVVPGARPGIKSVMDRLVDEVIKGKWGDRVIPQTELERGDEDDVRRLAGEIVKRVRQRCSPSAVNPE